MLQSYFFSANEAICAKLLDMICWNVGACCWDEIIVESLKISFVNVDEVIVILSLCYGV